jgi:hypothetical protein
MDQFLAIEQVLAFQERHLVLRLVAGRAEDHADERLELPSHLPEEFQRQKQELDMWGRFAAAQAKIANNGHERSVHMAVF